MEKPLQLNPAEMRYQKTLSLKECDAERPELFTVSRFRAFAKDTGLDTIPVQKMTRYRRIHWPFYHQFTVITTVKTQPSALQPEMFSLRKIFLDDLDPAANGISFRIDRGRRSLLGLDQSFEFGSHQASVDAIKIIRPGTEPLGGPDASSFEVIWCITRQPDLDPTPFSLRVGDIGLFVQWTSHVSPMYDLFRNNCWILSSSISHLTLYHYFQYEFDQASPKEIEAMQVLPRLIRHRVSKFFSGPTISLRWVALEARRLMDATGEKESTNNRAAIPFLSHPDRAGFGLLLNTCATSSRSPAGFANQPDDVLFHICLRLVILVLYWRAQIEEDPNMKDDFHRFIDEFSALGLHRPLMTLRPDIKKAYITTMTFVYMSSVTVPVGGYTNSTGLWTESVGKQFIPCIPQCIEYLNFANNAELRAILCLAPPLVSFEDELKELVRVDILSVLVKVFQHQRHFTSQNRVEFEVLLLQFCIQNPASRRYFLESDALFYVRDALMRKPRNPLLFSALYAHIGSESVVDLHNRLISCGVLVPLARCLALTNFHDVQMYTVLKIFISAMQHNKGEHLLERPILSYLAKSLNHPFSPISFGACGNIFRSLCALGDHAKKEVVNAGALPGLCRLAHRDTYDVNYEGTDHLLFENLLGDISQLDPSYAAIVAAAQKRYGRGFKVQTFETPRQTIRERIRAATTRYRRPALEV